MVYDRDRHHRQSIRWQGYDYARQGGYFITICTQHRQCLLGDVVNGTVRLSPLGLIVQEEWQRTALVRPDVAIDDFVIMPNHVHGIIRIDGIGSDGVDTDKISVNPHRATQRVAQTNATMPPDVGATRRVAQTNATLPPDVGATRRVAPHQAHPIGAKSGSLGAIIGQFKSCVSRRAAGELGLPARSLWQRSFFDRVIRDEAEFDSHPPIHHRKPAELG